MSCSILLRYLIQEVKVKSNEVILQLVERSIEMPIGLWAIMSAGAAYCAIDASDIGNQLYQLINQMRVTNILMHAATEPLLNG